MFLSFFFFSNPCPSNVSRFNERCLDSNRKSNQRIARTWYAREPRSTSRKANERGSRDSPQNPTNSNIYIGNSSRRHTISRLHLPTSLSHMLEHWNIRGYELVFSFKTVLCSPAFFLSFKSFISIISYLFGTANNILNNTSGQLKYIARALWSFPRIYLSTISSSRFSKWPFAKILSKGQINSSPARVIRIGHASSTWQPIFPRRNCQIIIRGGGERERKSRLRLAFCPGSLPAIRRLNAARA